MGLLQIGPDAARDALEQHISPSDAALQNSRKGRYLSQEISRLEQEGRGFQQEVPRGSVFAVGGPPLQCTTGLCRQPGAPSERRHCSLEAMCNENVFSPLCSAWANIRRAELASQIAQPLGSGNLDLSSTASVSRTTRTSHDSTSTAAEGSRRSRQ